MRTIESLVTYFSGEFPNTLGVNSTGPSTKDGTELVANLFNDYIGVFPQALLTEAGITPSGNAETSAICQQVDAVKTLISKLGDGWGVIGSAGAADPNHDVKFSVGYVPDSTRKYFLRCQNPNFTKQGDVAWAAGSSNGGLMGGTWSPDTEYGVYFIYNPTIRAVDAGFSVYTGAGVPTYLPAGYTIYQMVDWVKTDGSSNILQTVTREYSPGVIQKHWVTPLLDINLANTLTTARRLDAISVPTGFECDVNIHIYAYDATSSFYAFIGYPELPDVLPSGIDTSTIYNASVNTAFGRLLAVKTNTSKQIASRSSLATVDTYIGSTKSFTLKRF